MRTRKRMNVKISSRGREGRRKMKTMRTQNLFRGNRPVILDDLEGGLVPGDLVLNRSG